MIENTNPEIDVNELMDRVRLEATKTIAPSADRRQTWTRVLRALLPALRQIPDPPALALPRPMEWDKHSIDELLRKTRSKIFVSSRIPSIFRRFFQRQGGFNRGILDSINLLTGMTEQLNMRVRELTAAAEAQNQWLHILAEQRQSEAAWKRAIQDRLSELSDLQGQSDRNGERLRNRESEGKRASVLSRLAENGRSHAARRSDCNSAMLPYEKALVSPDGPHLADKQRPVKAVNQFLPSLAFGDAISNCTIWIRDQLRDLGFASKIYVTHLDPRVAHEASFFSAEALDGSDAAIYHHSTGSEIAHHVVNFSGPKCLIYHNITPPEFFEPYRPDFAQVLGKGREDLGKLAASFSRSCGASPYNARELEAHGFQNPTVLPFPVDPDKWSLPPDADLMAQLEDGRTNILFVGRIAPNKKQDDLVFAFDRYLELNPDARLILIGKYDEDDPYAMDLRNLIDLLDLQDSVILNANVNDAALAASYRTADLFWSMSEHEGFCVPLVEAMWFDVPVLAYRSSAVPETLGEAGLLFTEKSEPGQLAALAHLLVTDDELRRKILNAQRTQRLRFLPREVRPVLRELVEGLLGAPAAKS